MRLPLRDVTRSECGLLTRVVASQPRNSGTSTNLRSKALNSPHRYDRLSLLSSRLALPRKISRLVPRDNNSRLLSDPLRKMIVRAVSLLFDARRGNKAAPLRI